MIDTININKIVISSKVSGGKKDFKYFISYKDAKNIRPLTMFLPKTSAYRGDFDEAKYMSFSVKKKMNY